MEEFIEFFPVEGFDHVVDLDTSVWVEYGIISQPSFAFLDDDGTVTVHNGPLGEAGLSQRVEALLAT